MNVFSAAVAIMAIIALTEISKKWLEARRRESQHDPRIRAELESLRDRVETLERIVTDRREGLRQRYDEL